MSGHAQRAARSFGWTALESFGLSGLSFVSLVVLSRFLAPEEFGAAAIALGLVQILNLFVEITFHDALVQRRAVTERHFDTAFTASLVIGIALSGACWLGAETFAAFVGEPAVAPLLGWMSFSLPAMAFASSLVAEQRRRMEFRPLALRSLAGRGGAAVVAITAAVAGAGAWALVLQQVASVALAALTLWLLAARRPRLSLAWTPFRDLIGFGARTLSVNLVFFSIPRIFTIGVGTLAGAEAAGYLALAFRMVDMLRDLAAGAILQLSLPVFSRLQDDRAALERHFAAAVEVTSMATFPVFVGLGIVAPEAIRLLFGAEWLPAAPYVTVLALLTLVYFARMFSAPLAAALGCPHVSLASGLVQLAVVAAGLAAVDGISLAHAVGIWALRLVIGTPVDVAVLARASGIGAWRQVRSALPALAMSLAMAGVVLLVGHALGDMPLELRLAAMVASGAASYAVLVLLLRRALIAEAARLALSGVRRRAA